MATKPIALAVMGAGLIGKRHISHVLAHDTATLHAVIDPTDAGRAVAADAGAPWFPDFAAMLAQGRPDGLIIATPNQLHGAHGLAAIAAGIPVLVEKPIADTLAAGEALVIAAERAGVPLLIGHHRRHNPMIQRAKAIIEAGTLGKIVSVHAFFWLMKPDSYFDVPWRRQPGAGPVLLNFIHDIDLLRHLCGEVEAVQAFSSHSIRNHDVDETAVVILRFASGALGTVNISDTVVAPWNWEQTTGENPAYPRTDQTCYHIGGTHGALSVPRLEVWSNAAERGWLEPFEVSRTVAADADPLALQIAQFCRVIRSEETPLVSGRDGLANLKIVDAVERAARDGVVVKVLH
jgi:predicted dehydrogenase